MKKHKHHELIKEWADGAQIQFTNDFLRGNWRDTENPNWNIGNHKFRIKPSEPEWEPKPGEWIHASAMDDANADYFVRRVVKIKSGLCLVACLGSSSVCSYIKPFPLQIERDRYRKALETIFKEGTKCCFIAIAREALEL